MVSNPRSSIPLINFANDLKKSGLFIIGHVKLGLVDDFPIDPVVDEYPLWLKLLDILSVKAFFEITLAPSVREGFHHLVRMTGLGAMKSNTVFFGFYDNQEQIDFFQTDTKFALLKKNFIDENEFLRLRDKNQRNILPEDYVTLLYETIFKFQKNLCIGRHFNLFKKVLLFFLIFKCFKFCFCLYYFMFCRIKF